MPSSIWKLAYAGTTKTLNDWGIEDAQLHRRNLDTELFTFAIPTEDVFANPLFPHDAQITLYRESTIWFIGRVTARPAYCSGRERQRYVVSNSWARLLRIIYQQQYVLKTEDFTGVIGSWSTRVVLGQDAWGRKITASQQIQDISNYGNIVGSNLFTLAALGPYAIPPLETVRDITCVEAIRRMLAWTPDAVGAFDYSSGGTTLTILRRSGLASVSIDLDDQNLVRDISGVVLREDLVPTGVVIIYQLAERDESNEEVRSQLYTREVRDSAGLTAGVGVLHATVALGLQGTDQAEPVPVGLAAQYYAALVTPQAEGKIVIRDQCAGLLRPGKKLNLLNGQTAWATMGATIQESIEYLEAGETEVTFGFGPLLGLGDFVDMMRRFRERNEPGSFPSVQNNGTEGVETQVEGTDPSPDAENPIGAPGGAPDVAPGSRVSNTGKNGSGGAGGGGGAGAASGDAVTGGNHTVDLITCDGAGVPRWVTVLAP